MVYRKNVDNVFSIDYEPVRQRFPWVGLVNTGEHDLSGRYRDIMAEAQRDRAIVEAIDSIRRSA
ncbi:hypothetical protein GCM10012279_09780 [Micromonospora yangpuensis]|uniref:Uncharacterized protein n=1 Tax=Micromonospora yangpuensis TaxID=683228 RepID=A0A1C6UXB5_9ACTN|nr:hypothetical protein GCM10012279_09780 [Micromonospora yangpuensis]SCL58661.1 hypothetical protein GA0070617_3881 [Micromonospora yangpuensis]